MYKGWLEGFITQNFINAFIDTYRCLNYSYRESAIMFMDFRDSQNGIVVYK